MYICMYIPPVALWDHYKTSWNRETICRESVLEQVGLSPIWHPITDLVHTPFNRGQWDWKQCIIIRKRVHTRSELKQGCTKTNNVHRIWFWECVLWFIMIFFPHTLQYIIHMYSLSLQWTGSKVMILLGFYIWFDFYLFFQLFQKIICSSLVFIF